MCPSPRTTWPASCASPGSSRCRWWWWGRSSLWWTDWRTCCGRSTSCVSVPRPGPRNWRAPRRGPRSSWPATACPPRCTGPSRTAPRPRSTSCPRRTNSWSRRRVWRPAREWCCPPARRRPCRPCGPCCWRASWAARAGRWWWSSAWRARRCLCWPSATAGSPWACLPPRIISGCRRATWAPTRAAWGPTRPPRCSPRTSTRAAWPSCRGRWTAWPGRAGPTRACCTRGSC
mmetsp:Transcript_24736/g.33943  ORF Transcript_24736/g.33943 Transcript_24736/m.33943 type:complete len:231 (+) Transcript_24736:756-1448(+)